MSIPPKLETVFDVLRSGRSMDDLLAQLKKYKPQYRPGDAHGVLR